MTIGERIIQIRKEQGLSQEAFGDQLGVSRQAISKWEMDQSIPDVEKLIAMSRLYNISIGWILGTEETRKSPEELTEEQQRMVEQIAQQYIEAIPQPASSAPKLKKRVIIAGGLLLAVALVWGVKVSGKLSEIENRQETMDYSVSRINDQVSSQISSISYRVEEILKAQNSLLADYTASYGERDLRAGTVPITAAVTPKTYTPGMEIEFLLDDGVTSQRIPGVEGENHTFSMDAVSALTDSITLSVILRVGQTEQTQIIESWTWLFSETCVSDAMCGPDLWMEKLSDLRGENSIPHDRCELFSKNENAWGVVPTSVEIHLYLNGEKMADITTSPGLPDNYRGVDDYIGFTWQFPQKLGEQMKNGDTFVAALIVTDNYDRRYLTSLNSFVIEDERLSYADENPEWEEEFYLK